MQCSCNTLLKPSTQKAETSTFVVSKYLLLVCSYLYASGIHVQYYYFFFPSGLNVRTSKIFKKGPHSFINLKLSFLKGCCKNYLVHFGKEMNLTVLGQCRFIPQKSNINKKI